MDDKLSFIKPKYWYEGFCILKHILFVCTLTFLNASLTNDVGEGKSL